MNILNQSYEEIIKSKNRLGGIDADDNEVQVNTIKSNKLSVIYKLNEYQELFKKLFNQKQQQSDIQIDNNDHHSSTTGVTECNCNYKELEDNIFLSAFVNGNAKLCKLILSHYNSKYQFKLTNQSISNAILKNNIRIIYHFNDMLNIDLFNHLKIELKNHKIDLY